MVEWSETQNDRKEVWIPEHHHFRTLLLTGFNFESLYWSAVCGVYHPRWNGTPGNLDTIDEEVRWMHEEYPVMKRKHMFELLSDLRMKENQTSLRYSLHFWHASCWWGGSQQNDGKVHVHNGSAAWTTWTGGDDRRLQAQAALGMSLRCIAALLQRQQKVKCCSSRRQVVPSWWLFEDAHN